MDTKKIKKVELHLHLDGSLRPSTVIDIAKKEGIELPSYDEKELIKYLSVDETNKDLVEYLKKFNLPLKVMQTRENLERVTFELLEDLAKDNYIYVELRFAPHLHTKKGLNLSEIVESVNAGIFRAENTYPIKANVLLCIMRHMEVSLGYEIVDLAKKYLGEKVCGIDLAGDEFNYSVTLFKDVFARAKGMDIPFTIHSGEARGPESIVDALSVGAERLGHGIRAYENKELLEKLKENRITLECCPISNINTQIFHDFHDYPLKTYLNNGLKATINTDNRTVSNTNYQKEIDFLEKYTPLTLEEIYLANKNAIEGAFISKEEKEELLKKLNEN